MLEASFTIHEEEARPTGLSSGKGMKVSFLEKLEAAKVEALAHTAGDPWRLRLERVRGKVDYDNLERMSSQMLLDMLEVPQRSRTAGTYRRLAKAYDRTRVDSCAGPRPHARWLSRAGQGLLPRCTIPFEPKKPTLTLQRSWAA